MTLLLDSHTVLWWLLDSPSLSRTARAAIAKPGDVVLVSAVTFYELRLKAQSGRLHGVPEDLVVACAADGFRELPVTAAHASLAATLPLHHRDPWDRLLVAQARLQDCAIVSVDRLFRTYGARVVW